MKRALTEQHMDVKELLLAAIADSINVLNWIASGAARNGQPAPASIAEKMSGSIADEETDYFVYDSPEAFETARLKIIQEN